MKIAGKVFDFGGWPTTLQKASLPIHRRDDCESKFRSTKLGPFFKLHDSFICAGGEGNFKLIKTP